jgi:hypothetical protein
MSFMYIFEFEFVTRLYNNTKPPNNEIVKGNNVFWLILNE